MLRVSRGALFVSRGAIGGVSPLCRERAHHDRHQSAEVAAGEPQAAVNADAEFVRGEAVWATTEAENSASARKPDSTTSHHSSSAGRGAASTARSEATHASSAAASSASNTAFASAASSTPGATLTRQRRRHSTHHRYLQPGLAHLQVMLAPSPTSATAAEASCIPGAVGRVVAQISERVLAVQFERGPAASAAPTTTSAVSTRARASVLPDVQVGERASVLYELNEPLSGGSAGSRHGSGGGGEVAGPSPAPSAASSDAAENASSGVLVDGLIVRLNVDGTVVMLLDTGFLDLAVPRDSLTFLHRRQPSTSGEPLSGTMLASVGFADMLAWLAAVGTLTEEQQISTACVLYHRGWRADRLYLLERPDVDFLQHIPKPLRLGILEKAEWERDHHRQLRVIYRERVKEKDRRYLFSKYAGILSASVAFVGASSLFGWNYKNYLKQQRSYQMTFAVDSLQNTATVARRRRRAEAAAHTARTQSGWRASLSSWGSLFRRSEPQASSADEAAAAGASSSAASGVSNLASDDKTRMVPRTEEEARLRQLIRRLDCEHPRVPVLTGYYGCGKSSLCRHAMEKEGRAVVFVDVRSNEDMLRGTIKALGVPNVDACGDPLDFISEACHRATAAMRHNLLRHRRTASTTLATPANVESERASGNNGSRGSRPHDTPAIGSTPSKLVVDGAGHAPGLTRAELNSTMPIIVLKLREGDNLRRVYEEAIALAADRRVCHFVIEVPLESLTAANTALPGLDFYMVPNFSREEAFAYTQHRLDPLDLTVFMDTVGTNSNDLDELFAAVHQRQVSPTAYTNQKLLKAIRQLKEACAAEPSLAHVVKRLSDVPYDVGMEGRKEDSAALHHPALRDIVLYNPVKDLWLFNNEVLHTAAQCCF